MLENHLILAITVFLVIVALIMLGDKLGFSVPIFLVIAGLLISLVPGVPPLRLRTEFLFVIFLPPLLYRAAWNTCWTDFWHNRRPIGLHGFGLVAVTAGVVGLVAHALIPHFSLALGFVLGSIIAPPDALAATSILQRVRVPKRVITILEGESLVNDAASLVLLRFAVGAVASGAFSLGEASADFLFVSLAGIAVGLVIAVGFYVVHRFLPTTPNIDTALSLAAPYLMYVMAEKYHASGVLAVVSGGLFLSHHARKWLSSGSRLQMLAVWETIVFILNGIVFLVIGLQFSIIVKRLHFISVPAAIGYGAVISLVAIGIRMLWFFAVTYLPRLVRKRWREEDPYPHWKAVFLMGWCGMRGVVSLASALTLPMMLINKEIFPFRSLILLMTFTAILITLVLQGLSLPILIRWLRIAVPDTEKDREQELTTQLASAALKHLLASYGAEATTIDSFVRQRQKYERLAALHESAQAEDGAALREKDPRYLQMKEEMVAIRRAELARLRRENQYSDELIRQKEFELDWEQIALKR